MLETSSGDFHGAGDFWDFYGSGDFFGGIFTVLETSSGDFLGGIFKVLETSSGDFHSSGDFFCRFSRCWRFLEIFMVLETFCEWIFMVLETSSGDFFGGFSRCWRHLWRIFTVLET